MIEAIIIGVITNIMYDLIKKLVITLYDELKKPKPKHARKHK